MNTKNFIKRALTSFIIGFVIAVIVNIIMTYTYNN